MYGTAGTTSIVALAVAVVAAAAASASTPSKFIGHHAKVIANVAIPEGTGGLAVGEGAVWALS